MAQPKFTDYGLEPAAIAPGRMVARGNPRSTGLCTGRSQMSAPIPGWYPQQQTLMVEVHWITGQTTWVPCGELQNFNRYLVEMEREVAELVRRRYELSARLGTKALPDY
jgi:hypothetical protein